MKKLFQKFTPIISECNQGQKKLGVKKGGVILYNEIFKNMNHLPYLLDNKNYNNASGYKNLYQLCSNIETPLNLGGDHSIGAATVMASLYKYPSVKVIWIDGHADINTHKSSKSKNTHGMPVSMCLGLDKYWWNEKRKLKLPFENLIYVGIRDLDDFEKEIIKKYNIKVLCPQKVIELIKKSDKVHISFDVDAIDPKYLNSTGTIADKGLSPFEIRKIITSALKNNKLVGLDVVEFNPELGNYKKSLETLLKIFTV